ncbi:trypsin-like serine protease [Enterococcus faecalis]
MKKSNLVFGILLCFISFSSVKVHAQDALDTVYDDGTLSEFSIQETLSEVVDTEAVDVNSVSEQGFIPEIPANATYISDREEAITSEPSAEKILGTDNRKIVSNTTIDPYKKIAFLLITYPNGKKFIGSGNLVSSDTVLTAGHCLYDKDMGGFAKSIAVYPGYNGNYAPFGVAYSKKLMTVRAWVDSSSPQHDIGAIKLDRPIGSKVGWFGLTTNPTSPITLSGYHGDLNRKMGTETGNISRLTTNNVYYQLDSTGGSSGSGVYNNNKQILAVHAYGSNYGNYGTRINTHKLNVVKSWITLNPVAPTNTTGVNYNSHVAELGWLVNVANGGTSGTTGQNRRMEAIKININDSKFAGSIQYRTHVKDKGWLNWVSNGTVSGTTGQKRQMEAIQIKLTGELSSAYNIQYRTHLQNKGWTSWVSNGATSGTTGQNRQMEAIQIRLVKK